MAIQNDHILTTLEKAQLTFQLIDKIFKDGTIAELSRKVGITRQTLYKLNDGKNSLEGASYRSVKKLADVYDDYVENKNTKSTDFRKQQEIISTLLDGVTHFTKDEDSIKILKKLEQQIEQPRSKLLADTIEMIEQDE